MLSGTYFLRIRDRPLIRISSCINIQGDNGETHNMEKIRGRHGGGVVLPEYRWRYDNKRGTMLARREISVPGSNESAAMMDFFHFLNAAKERAEFRD